MRFGRGWAAAQKHRHCLAAGAAAAVPNGAERLAFLLARDGLHEGRRQRHAERTVEAGAGAGREVAEQLAAIVIHAVAGAHGEFWRGDQAMPMRGAKPHWRLVHQGIAGARCRRRIVPAISRPEPVMVSVAAL